MPTPTLAPAASGRSAGTTTVAAYVYDAPWLLPPPAVQRTRIAERASAAGRRLPAGGGLAQRQSSGAGEDRNDTAEATHHRLLAGLAGAHDPASAAAACVRVRRRLRAG